MDWDLDGIVLPGDLEWEDEYRWNTARQQRSHSLTGALIIQDSGLLAGRPITLVSRTEIAWVTRATVEALRALEAGAPASMTLTAPDARTFTVAFRIEGETAVEATPVLFLSPPQAGDFYELTLRLIEL